MKYADVSYDHLVEFSEALALFIAIYVTFNVQYMHDVAHTIQFIHKVVAKFPISESHHALHGKRKTNNILPGVMKAESSMNKVNLEGKPSYGFKKFKIKDCSHIRLSLTLIGPYLD